MLPATMSIAITEAKHAAESEHGGLTEKLKAAMRVCHDHWMVTNEDEQFRSAVGGVMLHYGEGSQEFERLKREMEELRRLAVAISDTRMGVEVDWPSLITEHLSTEPIGLMKLWRETRRPTTHAADECPRRRVCRPKHRRGHSRLM
jgi:hypothetical protein